MRDDCFQQRKTRRRACGGQKAGHQSGRRRGEGDTGEKRTKEARRGTAATTAKIRLLGENVHKEKIGHLSATIHKPPFYIYIFIVLFYILFAFLI